MVYFMSSNLPGNATLAYMGLKERNPPNIITTSRDPLASDWRGVTIGDFWCNRISHKFWILVSNAQNLAVWDPFAGSVIGGVETINTISPNGAGEFAIDAGTGIKITPGANKITVEATGGTDNIASFKPDSGTDPVVPTAGGLVTMAGSGSVTTVGGVHALTTSLTGLTSFNVLVGAGTTTIAKVAPGAAGIPLVSTGVAAYPSFTTALVAGGGTGATTLSTYAVLCGGTTSTSAVQQVSGLGTVGQVLKSNGAATLPSWQTDSSSPGFTSIVVQTFTVAGAHTYTPTLGMSYCMIEVAGGGGGGGGTSASDPTNTTCVGSGGGGGGYARGVFTSANIGVSKAVVVGAAGVGVPSSAGTAGGTTSVGALISADGGSAGNISLAVAITGIYGGAGGAATGGDFQCTGTAGGAGMGIGSAAPKMSIGGSGGGTFFGGGANQSFLDGVATLNGNNATSYGGGGGGACNIVSSISTGGSGASGVVIITEYIV